MTSMYWRTDRIRKMYVISRQHYLGLLTVICAQVNDNEHLFHLNLDYLPTSVRLFSLNNKEGSLRALSETIQ